MPGKGKNLTTLQRRFVMEYLKHGNGTKAAIDAGYAQASAKHTAYELLKNNDLIKAEVDKQRKDLQEKSGYNLEKAMKEAEDAMDFAKETKNANAYVKAAELRAKLNGLLIDRHDVRQLGHFEINISGFKHKEEDDIEEE